MVSLGAARRGRSRWVPGTRSRRRAPQANGCYSGASKETRPYAPLVNCSWPTCESTVRKRSAGAGHERRPLLPNAWFLRQFWEMNRPFEKTRLTAGRAALLAALAVPYPALAQGAHATQRRADTSRSLSPASAPPVTVADLIGMTTIGSRVQGYGNDHYDVLSPAASPIPVLSTRADLTHT